MAPDRPQRLLELVAAVQLQPPARWRDLLRELAHDDELVDAAMAELRRRAAAVAGAASAPAARPEQIGPYRLLDELGQGGMGTVYLAEQREPVQRRVALKVIKLGMDSKAVVARFEQERQALAMMAHDGIAKVYDCGTTERGQPFFVMEHVKGVPLTQFCDDNRVPLSVRLQLLQRVCSAVQHAHQKGVVHRDLKPGNVLVSSHEGKLEVKVIDFGLAKAMGQKLVEATLFTAAGQIVGTPEYMAPEQADPGNADIDTRADVYSLGVMLYELLVGVLPFSPGELQDAGMLEMQRLLREVDPPRPSARITGLGRSAEVAAARRMSIGALRKVLRSDLDWVVVKALEKDRNRRYESASALAADLQRFLDHQPVVAGPPSATYRLKKLLWRYRGQAMAAVVVLATAIVGAGVATYFWWRANDSAAELDRQLGPRRLLACDRLFASEPALGPAWPATVPARQRWLAEAEHMLAERGNVRAQAAAAAPATAGVASGDAASVGTDGDREALTQLLTKLDQLEVLAKKVRTEIEAADLLQRASLRPRAGLPSWADARAAIQAADGVVASRLYRDQHIDLRDENVTGLVPIGRNPVTGLWEFYDLRSAGDGTDPRGFASLRIPVLSRDGGLDVDDASGIVFVLLPGGTFAMGDASLYDARPVRQVSVDPFFMARYELTRGQWERLAATRPFRWQPKESSGGIPIGARHPAENMDWNAADACMQRFGMCLPDEAHWEYGCRAGKDTAWSTGAAAASLEHYANLCDRSGIERLLELRDRQPVAFDDGCEGIAVVGSFQPNAFGLYDMHGNVAEWCSGYYGDGRGSLRLSADEQHQRVVRGGSYQTDADPARSSAVYPVPRASNSSIGIRPVRLLKPI